VPVRVLSGISGIHHTQAPYIAGIILVILSDHRTRGIVIPAQYRFG